MDLFSELMGMSGSEVLDKRTKIIKAPFGIPGGKNRSVHQIVPHLPIRSKWVDVFGGSGVVTWNYPLARLNVFNDAYSGITDFYKCIQDYDQMNLLIEKLQQMPPLSREMFQINRDTWCTETDAVTRAAKWFYMVTCSVVNKRVAFARVREGIAPIKLPGALKLFEPVHLVLQNVQIENLDWRQCIIDFDSPDAVFYFDPPYVDSDQGTYEKKFTRDDLKELLERTHFMKGFVALSHYDDVDINCQSYWRDKYSWEVVATSDTGNQSKKERKRECLWIKE